VMPVIGFLSSLGRDDLPNYANGFRSGLSEVGYVGGRNVAIEYRFAENQRDRLPALVADLVGRKVAVIAATGGGASILAAKAATTTIPIVFTFGGDPVREGYVASLNRPGGNVTGITWFNGLLSAKALGLLHELVPNAAVIAIMTNPKLPESARTLSDAEEAARTLGRQLLVLLMPASRARSTPPSPPCGNSALTRSLSAPIRSLPAGGSRSSRWRHVTPSRRCTPTANMSWLAG